MRIVNNCFHITKIEHYIHVIYQRLYNIIIIFNTKNKRVFLDNLDSVSRSWRVIQYTLFSVLYTGLYTFVSNLSFLQYMLKP